jgi:hypothetical protein
MKFVKDIQIACLYTFNFPNSGKNIKNVPIWDIGIMRHF